MPAVVFLERDFVDGEGVEEIGTVVIGTLVGFEGEDIGATFNPCLGQTAASLLEHLLIMAYDDKTLAV